MNNIEKQIIDDVVIFKFTWTLNDDSCSTFSYIKDELFEKKQYIILNFKELTYLNTTAIWNIVDIYSYVDRYGWDLFISHASDDIKTIFNIVWLYDIIWIFDDEESLIKSINLWNTQK